MATRTIESPKDRLVTILIAPLMSCSARLPVYTLLISACIPDIKVLGILRLAGLTMLGMYLLGIVVALLVAWVLKQTLLKGDPPLLIMELPPYRWPGLRQVLRHMWERAKIFLHQAGTIILGVNILLWFLASYPRIDVATLSRSTIESKSPQSGLTIQKPDDSTHLTEKEIAGEQLRHSFAGKLGRLIEPVIAPLGFDWKIGIGIVASFAAREVFVSAMATVYNVGDYDRSESSMKNLSKTLQLQKRPDGTPVYTTLTCLTLMVFYVFALQCASTVAVVRRETNSWKWPLFQWLYMAVLAWGFAFTLRQVGLLLGLS